MEILSENSPEFKEIHHALDTLEEKISSLVTQTARQEILSSNEACQLLGVSKRTLNRYRDNLSLPHSRIGDKVFYRLDDLQKFLDKHIE